MATVSSPLSESALTPEYWEETRHPWACLVFLAPLLVVYECGALWLATGPDEQIRNGADFWMRGWLHGLGFSHAWLLPVLVISGLLTWQMVGRYPWRLSLDTLGGMLAESLVFAFVLILAGQLQDMAFQQLNLPTLEITRPPLTALSPSAGARAITFIGAGVYEEFLFRLCLLPATFAALRTLRMNLRWSTILSVVITGLLFSGAHYVGPAGESFQLFSFTFRLMAGLFFAALFYLRGFGITVGAHAAYDLLVGIILFPPN